MAAFRIGLFTAIRSKFTGAAAIMITASHNMWEDNGVKIIERDGNMLDANWEDFSTMIVNSPDLCDTIRMLNEIWLKGFFCKINILADEKSPNP
jgi:phosphomannomutase